MRHLHGAGLAPYHANLRKRLIKRPKVYIRDPGLLDALAGLDSLDALLAHPVAGHSWEGVILEQIIHRLSRRRGVLLRHRKYRPDRAVEPAGSTAYG